jgi:hypothetical protein
MQSKSPKIAYLKRVLKRLKGEDTRLQNFVSGGELTRQAADLAVQHESSKNIGRDETNNIYSGGVRPGIPCACPLQFSDGVFSM